MNSKWSFWRCRHNKKCFSSKIIITANAKKGNFAVALPYVFYKN